MMAALTFRMPGDLAMYRDATNRQTSMAGVTGPSFRCAKCRQIRSTAGRREAIKGYRRAGYHCRECAQ